MDSPFFFGRVSVDTPVKAANGPEYMDMVELQGIDRLYMRVFNFTFILRPILKLVALGACGLIGLIILAYFLRALTVISNACAEEDK